MVHQIEEMTGQGAEQRVQRLVVQACALPYRETERGIEVCLITSLRKKRWIFPKGPVDRLGLVESAAKHAADEAGVYGRVSEELVGNYKRLKDGRIHMVNVYSMEVDRCEEIWFQARERQRQWATVEQARSLLVKPELEDMLGRVVRRLLSE